MKNFDISSEIFFSPMYANIFCDAGQVPILRYFEACICFDIDKIKVGIVSCHFLLICNRVNALDLCQNFVFTQFLENKWIEFHQILYMHLY